MQTTGKPVSLYFHLPFCEKKCPYCHFYVIPPTDFHKKLLLEALFLEWTLLKEKLQEREIVSIYFGGGTPSLFLEGVETILAWIYQSGISLANGLEVTLEANPDNLDMSKIGSLRNFGINRVSLGVQSFEEEELSLLGRTHNTHQVERVIESLIEKGISNISLDLMYDIPSQKRDSFKRSLRKIQTLPITHLSLYNLVIEPHTLFYKHRKKLEKTLPSEKESSLMLQDALQILKETFFQYEISAFCKENLFSRHNVGYWIGRDFLGLGPSSSSYLSGVRRKNLSSILKYHKLLTQKKLPLEYEDVLSVYERQKELFCLKLRMIEGVFKESFSSLLQVDSFQKKLQKLAQKGLLEENQTSWKLTEKGLFFHDEVASDLI